MNQSLGKWLLRCGIACLFVPYALPLLAYAWSDSLAISMPLMDWLASIGLLLVGAVLCLTPPSAIPPVLQTVGIGRGFLLFLGVLSVMGGALDLLGRALPSFDALMNSGILGGGLFLALYIGFAIAWGRRGIPFGGKSVRPTPAVLLLRLLTAAVPIGAMAGLGLMETRNHFSLIGGIGAVTAAMAALLLLLSRAERRAALAACDLTGEELQKALFSHRARLKAVLRGLLLFFLAACIGLGGLFLLIYALSGGGVG